LLFQWDSSSSIVWLQTAPPASKAGISASNFRKTGENDLLIAVERAKLLVMKEAVYHELYI
jgi:hypothetical protein